MRIKQNPQVISFRRVPNSELVRAFVCFQIGEHQKNEWEEKHPCCRVEGIGIGEWKQDQWVEDTMRQIVLNGIKIFK